jgi:hypothetical protein
VSELHPADAARKAFEAKGMLYQCPNKPHDFQVGRLVGTWSWAKDCWSTLTASGHLQNNFLLIGTTHHVDGMRIYKVIVWKFSLMFGFIQDASE